ncbi:hypothetical protein BH24ACT13_BH24ACT13_01880 [soil metagenome]
MGRRALMQRSAQRALVIWAIGAAVLVGLAVSVLAGAATMGGQQDCAADETPITQLKAPDGDLFTVAPGANSQVYHGYYPFWGTVSSASNGTGGDWQATVDSADPRLSSRETYAACVS